ncbi:MAG: L,D-transpeptidase family protein [Chitinophagaceae bacterium]
MACNGEEKKPKNVDIVEHPAAFDVRVSDNIKSVLGFALDNKGRLNDTVVLDRDTLVNQFYNNNEFKPLWCDKENWLPSGNALLSFIENAKEYGLFPTDYHYRPLSNIQHSFLTDSTARKNAALWARADLMMTDAFVQLARHLKQGRLPYDSVTLRTDSVLGDDFYHSVWERLRQTGSVISTLHELEPKHPGYDSLKTGLKFFLDSVGSFKRYTYLPFPIKDSAAFFRLLQKRLFESDLVPSPSEPLDTAAWRQVLSNFQATHEGLKVTGRINENTVLRLNNTDWEKFKRIAITLDRYKLLPDSMPVTYVWVNLPAYTMRVYNSDTLVLESRVIVGQPRTRTPLLTSQISNFITYPQWTVPTSIIFKEMLPQIKRNVAYLAKQNLMVVDNNDSILDPANIDWSKMSKNHFPYKLRQRQGDDNSLGVLKFNFPNKYSVYLHDTNARWLFSKSSRALSHGCVRVKEFEKLADFLVRNDTIRYHPDTLRNWIKREEKHVVSGFQRTPIFIRYFTCEGKNDRVKFYDDIYGEDKLAQEALFADKPVQ